MAADSIKIPFSVYDFFGYLASGFFLLAAIDFAFNGGWFLKKDLTLSLGVFWTIVGYVLGHIIANISSYLLERKLVRGLLRSPEETLFQPRPTKRWVCVFPGFFDPLPKETQKRVLEKAKAKAGIEKPGRGLFYHCHPIVKHDQITLERMNTFLNLYGFCRNISMAALLVIPVLIAGAILDARNGNCNVAPKLWLAAAAFLISVAMLYRYLKFFRLYTVEVFTTYAELN